MNKVDHNYRNFWTHIFTLDRNRYQKVVSTLDEAISRSSIEDRASESDDVYCIAAQLFPISYLNSEIEKG